MSSTFGIQDPFAEKIVYKDGPIDKFFINYFARVMAKELGEYAPIACWQYLRIAVANQQHNREKSVEQLHYLPPQSTGHIRNMPIRSACRRSVSWGMRKGLELSSTSRRFTGLVWLQRSAHPYSRMASTSCLAALINKG